MASSSRLLRGAFFCCAKRKRPSDSPKGKGACWGADVWHRLCLPPGFATWSAAHWRGCGEIHGARPRPPVAVPCGCWVQICGDVVGSRCNQRTTLARRCAASHRGGLAAPVRVVLAASRHRCRPSCCWCLHGCGSACRFAACTECAGGIGMLTITPYKQSPPPNAASTTLRPPLSNHVPHAPTPLAADAASLQGVAAGARADVGPIADLRGRTMVAAGCGVPTRPRLPLARHRFPALLPGAGFCQPCRAHRPRCAALSGLAARPRFAPNRRGRRPRRPFRRMTGTSRVSASVTPRPRMRTPRRAHRPWCAVLPGLAAWPRFAPSRRGRRPRRPFRRMTGNLPDGGTRESLRGAFFCLAKRKPPSGLRQ